MYYLRFFICTVRSGLTRHPIASVVLINETFFATVLMGFVTAFVTVSEFLAVEALYENDAVTHVM
jgi:hypothetical protein